jgi:hypothetical protein
MGIMVDISNMGTIQDTNNMAINGTGGRGDGGDSGVMGAIGVIGGVSSQYLFFYCHIWVLLRLQKVSNGL